MKRPILFACQCMPPLHNKHFHSHFILLHEHREVLLFPFKMNWLYPNSVWNILTEYYTAYTVHISIQFVSYRTTTETLNHCHMTFYQREIKKDFLSLPFPIPTPWNLGTLPTRLPKFHVMSTSPGHVHFLLCRLVGGASCIVPVWTEVAWFPLIG